MIKSPQPKHPIVLIVFALSVLACSMPFAPAPEATLIAPTEGEPSAAPTSQLTPSVTLEPTTFPSLTPQPSAMPITVTGISEISYLLPLTVQHVTESTASLFFELATPSEGMVLITPVDTPGEQQSILLSPTDARLQITVEGLNPGTHYEAAIGLGADSANFAQPVYGDQVWGPIQFTTPDGEEPLRIAVIGDSGFGQQITFDLALQMAAQNPDFVINTGDVVYNVEEHSTPYDAFRLKWYMPLQPLLKQMPVYPVVGNHDIEQATRLNGVPFYYLAFPPFAAPPFPESGFEGRNQWYAFAYSDWQFVMLDTQTFFGEAGREEQNAFLEERLADERFAHTIASFHVPPMTSSNVHPHDGAAVHEQWSPLFEAAAVPLVLTGHSHNYERIQLGAVTYIVSGGGSATLYGEGERLPESQVFAARTHFVLLDLYGDRIDITAMTLEGEVLDQRTILLQ